MKSIVTLVLLSFCIGSLALAQETFKLANAVPVRAFMDDEAPGWRSLEQADFAHVNSAEDTWSWQADGLHCTGQPISVLRTASLYTNFEMVVEWSHLKEAGNSGVFVWTTPPPTTVVSTS